MDDLFGTNESASDPTADFLRREQEALGADAGAFGNSTTNTTINSSNNDSMAARQQQRAAGSTTNASYDDFERSASQFPDLDDDELVPTAPAPRAAAAAAQPVSVTGNDDLAAFEEEYPEIEVPATTSQPQTNGFSSTPAPAAAVPAAAPAAATSSQEDSEFIREWRTKQKQDIDEREQANAKKKEELIVKAQHAIDEFYKDYNAKKEKNIARNKEREAKLLQDMTDELGRGTTWERICNTIELADSRSKTISKSKQDLTRFKEILLSLRKEGESAPGAAGY